MSKSTVASTATTAHQEALWLDAVYAAQLGGSEAQIRLVRLVQPRLYAFCLRLAKRPEHAQEICQEAWIRILKALGGLREPHRFRSWAFRIAKHVFLNRASARTEVSIETVSAVERVSEAHDPELELGMRRALEDLKPEDRSAILIVDVGGATYAEAAAELQLTKPALRSRLVRARARLGLALG